MKSIAEPDDMLTADRVIAEVLLPSETPSYSYDLGKLRSRVQEFQDALCGSRASLYFATMANDNPCVLRELSALGVGACVNSLAHLDLARGNGFPSSRTQFTSTGLSAAILFEIGRRKIRINLDSIGQIEIWGQLGFKAAGLRINAASLGQGRPFDRLGTSILMLSQAQRAAQEAGTQIEGLHVYLGTNLLDIESARPSVEALFEAAASVDGLAYVNIGGGIGVDYARTGQEFDMAAYGRVLRDLTQSLEAKIGHSVEVIVEPGRALVAGCGVFLTRVTDIKSLGGHRYVGVDASVAQFPRPFHHPETPHQISVSPRPGLDLERSKPCIVVGCTTFSKDILGAANLPEDLSIGDILLCEDAGAYSESMISRFLGQPHPTTRFE